MSDNHSNSSKNLFGFWIYIMSDCILFATLFATYVVLQSGTFGGPTAKELFSMPYVLCETIILLTSSFTCGVGALFGKRNNKIALLTLLGITFLLGLSFVGMEVHEFSELVKDGNSWQKSAFLSAFFTLVGTHGLHVTFGLVWILMLIMQILIHGVNDTTNGKIACFGLFWHFLDIIWIFVFTIVYLIGNIL